MKKQVLFFLLLFMPLLTNAYEVEVNGIYYNLNTETKKAMVTHGTSKYIGDIVIPVDVEYDNVTYSVASIGESAFSNCRELYSVIIPNSVNMLEDFCFNLCTGLKTIIIPNSVTYIGNGAFQNCFELNEISIPNSVISIGNGAFWSCTGLSSLTLGNSLCSIGIGAFEYCLGLTSVTIPNSLTSIADDTFHGCSMLTSLSFSNNIKSIGSSAFRDCKELTSVNIPNSVELIKDCAFDGCVNLTTVTISKNIVSIEENAFWGCDKLTNVICLSEKVPLTAETSFSSSSFENATLQVPGVSINSYNATFPWNSFKQIVSVFPKCEKPNFTILSNGKIKVESATEGATCVTNITASNAEPLTDGEISLNTPLNVYTVTAYAIKEGFDDSEVATATFRYEKTEGDMNGDGQVNVSDVVQLVNTILSK